MSPTRDSARSESGHLYERSAGETPSEAVIFAVAESVDQSPVEMDPLSETIDPDALNQLFDTDGGVESAPTVTFEYCGRAVTVTPDEVHVDQQA